MVVKIAGLILGQQIAIELQATRGRVRRHVGHQTRWTEMRSRELHGREIEEVISRWQAGPGQRTARATGLARETSQKYLAAPGTLGPACHRPTIRATSAFSAS
jgi:hypothetical protein